MFHSPPRALQRKRRPLIQDVRSAFLDIDLVKEGGLMHEPMDEWTFESRIYSKFMCLLLLMRIADTNADMSPSVYRDAVLEAMGEKGASAEKMKSFYLGFNGYVAGILPRFDQFQIFVASRSQDGL
jgi:hypothetical protein